MSKITLENKKGKITIINRLTYPETVNERVYTAIASGMFEGFLPVSIRQKRKETRLECTVQGMIPLNAYFCGIVTKKMFLDFVHDIAQQIKTCEKNMINPNNLDLQSDTIFIDPLTKRVKCIFWPIVNNQSGNQPHMFLKQLPFQLSFHPHEDKEYLEIYKSFFNGMNPFSINAFDRMLMKLSGKKSTNGLNTPSSALSGTLSSEIMGAKSKKSNIEYDPCSDNKDNISKTRVETESKREPDRIFCSVCGSQNRQNSNYCIHCGAGLKPIEKVAPPIIQDNVDEFPSDFGTMVLGDNSGGTTVLGYNEPEEPIFPKLLRLKTNETFVVDKPVYTIGADSKNCDLVIDGNTFISRGHADIIIRDERFYIKDRKSTNKTFVDGKVIPVETEVEIFSGTEIRLANEDFTFSIES